MTFIFSPNVPWLWGFSTGGSTLAMASPMLLGTLSLLPTSLAWWVLDSGVVGLMDESTGTLKSKFCIFCVKVIIRLVFVCCKFSMLLVNTVVCCFFKNRVEARSFFIFCCSIVTLLCLICLLKVWSLMVCVFMYKGLAVVVHCDWHYGCAGHCAAAPCGEGALSG